MPEPKTRGFFDRLKERLNRAMHSSGNALGPVSPNADDTQAHYLNAEQEYRRYAEDGRRYFDAVLETYDRRTGAYGAENKIMRMAHDGLDMAARDDLRRWFEIAYAESRTGEGSILPYSRYTQKGMEGLRLAPSDLLRTFHGHTQAAHIRDWHAMGVDFTTSAVDTPLLAYNLKHGEQAGMNALLSIGVPTDITLERQYYELKTDASHPATERISLLRAAYEKKDTAALSMLIRAKAADLRSDATMETLSDTVCRNIDEGIKASVDEAQKQESKTLQGNSELLWNIQVLSLLSMHGYFKEPMRSKKLDALTLRFDPRFSSASLKNKENDTAYQEIIRRHRDDPAFQTKLKQWQLENDLMDSYANRPDIAFAAAVRNDDGGPTINTISTEATKTPQALLEERKALDWKAQKARMAQSSLGFEMAATHLMWEIAKQDGNLTQATEGNKGKSIYKGVRHLPEYLILVPELANERFQIAFDPGMHQDLRNTYFSKLSESQKAFYNRGDTMAAMFYRTGNTRYFEMCLNGGAVNFNLENNQGESLLGQMAAKQDWSNLVRAVDKYGADINYTDSMGRNLADIAMVKRQSIIAELNDPNVTADRFHLLKTELNRIDIFCEELLNRPDFRYKDLVRTVIALRGIENIPDEPPKHNPFEQTYQQENPETEMQKALALRTSFLGYSPEDSTKRPKSVEELLAGMPLTLSPPSEETHQWCRKVYDFINDPSVSKDERNQRQSSFIRQSVLQLTRDNRLADAVALARTMMTEVDGYDSPKSNGLSILYIRTLASAGIQMVSSSPKNDAGILSLSDMLSDMHETASNAYLATGDARERQMYHDLVRECDRYQQMLSIEIGKNWNNDITHTIGNNDTGYTSSLS